MKTSKSAEHPWTHCIREDFGDKIPKVFGFFHNFEPTLFIADPDMVHEIFITKNKFFDKHHSLREAFYPMTGQSILFDRSTAEWQTRRKVVSAAFYKEKLQKMTLLIKQVTKQTLAEWREEFAVSGKPINIVAEISNLFIRIILACAFGKDISNNLVMIETNGVVTYEKLGFAFRN